jgi:hypothetical protein
MAGQNAEKMFRPHIACSDGTIENYARRPRINIINQQPCDWFTSSLLHPISVLRKGPFLFPELPPNIG